ncbi:tyrosine-type recombinase/integrase [Paenibacillus sp. MZ04-78.2]|uniref:site-specific integrase n=1 Tax=Paenibacillus sp. MZ04-78.2 TaxID=2962034 RepID=UPI0020B6BFF8|nr:site-specific integrase [Paenibacillus sp. MZ04-78.2]MCP3773750.1 tyrosine-type recombinase/integrase [Paenibacillus sp. MZ04-78.2]
MASGSIKKDKNTGKYYYVVDVGKDGERKQKKKRGFATKKEAEIALAKLLTEVNDGTYLEPSKNTLVQLMEKWIESKKGNMTRLTVDSYKSYIVNHIAASNIGLKQLAKLSSDDIEEFIKYLRTKKTDKGKNLSDSTIQRIFNIVVTALNYAKKMKYVKENVALNVDRPQISKRKLQVWDVEEVNKFLEHIKKYRHFLAFYLAIHTGMRQGEILGLPWSNVDFDNKIIRVTQTLEHDAKGITEGAKTNSSVRSISISDEVMVQLKKQYHMIEEEKENAGELYQDNDLVICTNIGKPVFADTLTKFMRKSIRELNITPIRFHDLRHTSASLILKIGVHPKIVSERLGHSSVTITLDTYSHLLPNMQEEAAKRLSNLLNEPLQ